MAIVFNGTSQYLRIASNALFNFSPSCTLMAWANTSATNLTSLPQRIFSRYLDGATANEQYGIDIYMGMPRFIVSTTTATTTLAANNAVIVNSWNHIAATYDGSTMILYVNGAQMGTVARSGTITSSTGVLTVGADYNGTAATEFFTGSLEDLKLYSRALSGAEIQTIAISRGTTNIRNNLILNLLLDESRRGTALAASATVYDTGPYKLNATNVVASATFADGYLRKRRFI